jgi:hypothetical protein
MLGVIRVGAKDICIAEQNTQVLRFAQDDKMIYDENLPDTTLGIDLDERAGSGGVQI